MNQFIFEKRQRTLFGVMMLIGVISLVITYMGDDQFHTRFWSNVLHNSVFFTGIGLLALFMLAAKITAWAGWYTLFKRVWEAFALFLIVGLILMTFIAIGIWAGWHHLYHWADAESVSTDSILQGKSSFLNKGWYTFGGIIIMGVWILITTKIRALSVDEDTNGDTLFTHAKKMRIWGAAALPIIGFTSAAMIWLWVMSVDAHWYSTLFAWYSSVSLMVAMVALTIITLIALKIRGYFPLVTIEHFHDLAKYLFAFSIFWTYMWFSQFMLIWYGNIPEETIYYNTRLNQYPVLLYLNIVLNFVLPFLVLLRNDTKRKYGTLLFISCMLVLSHWLDFFVMLKPGILHTAQELAQSSGGAAAHHAGSTPGFTLPGFPEIGTFIGFLGLFFYYTFSRLEKASLLPRRDPYLMESISHHA
ncbi:MAG TPA: hypothetical protein VMZ69_11015 [Saprospiraceae bacterium]|nr:hypothetical protein [Saprospiraceae bacterium]